MFNAQTIENKKRDYFKNYIIYKKAEDLFKKDYKIYLKKKINHQIFDLIAEKKDKKIIFEFKNIQTPLDAGHLGLREQIAKKNGYEFQIIYIKEANLSDINLESAHKLIKEYLYDYFQKIYKEKVTLNSSESISSEIEIIKIKINEINLTDSFFETHGYTTVIFPTPIHDEDLYGNEEFKFSIKIPLNLKDLDQVPEITATSNGFAP